MLAQSRKRTIWLIFVLTNDMKCCHAGAKSIFIGSGAIRCEQYNKYNKIREERNLNLDRERARVV